MASNNINTVDVFASYILEDVEHCDAVDVVGGLQPAEIFYCYLPDILTLRTPPAFSTNESAGTIKSMITCKQHKGFKKIKALIDTAGLSSKFSGKSDSSTLNGFLLGTRGQLIGMSRKLRYRPFVFIVKDNNGRQFIIGNLVSPAYLKNFDLNTGIKYEDDNGASFTIESSSIIYEYKPNIPVLVPQDLDGDFDDDFENEFD